LRPLIAQSDTLHLLEEEGFMKRTLVIIAGILMTLELLTFDHQRAPNRDQLSYTNPSPEPELVLASDPALRYISEDSPYMRSER
jgi:hypothetical protein